MKTQTHEGNLCFGARQRRGHGSVGLSAAIGSAARRERKRREGRAEVQLVQLGAGGAQRGVGCSARRVAVLLGHVHGGRAVARRAFASAALTRVVRLAVGVAALRAKAPPALTRVNVKHIFFDFGLENTKNIYNIYNIKMRE